MDFTIVDEYSRFLEALAIDSATSESLINLLDKEFFARYGLPTSIHADNGSQFI